MGGAYFGEYKLYFEGADIEKRMMEKLLQLMAPGSDEKDCCLPVKGYYDFYTGLNLETALLGPLPKDEKFYFLDVFNPTKAPRLIAALFPNSRFRFDATAEYENCSDDSPYYTAIYEDHTLKIREAYLYPSNMDEEIKSLCLKLLKADPDAEEKVESHREEYGLGEEEENVWYDLLDDLVDNREEIVASLYEFYEVPPAIDEEYIKSFFDGDDLLAYLEGQ